MKTFAVGTVLNPLKHISKNPVPPKFKEVSLNFPGRLNAMALDPGKINLDNKGIYTPGEIIFSIGLYKKVYIQTRNDRKISITERSPRKQLIRHAVLLMQSALKINTGFNIDVELSNDLRHCGLGSSSSLIASIASAINELFGNYIESKTLIRYLAQNHGEEIDHEEGYLQHVQCIGGGATCGLIKAGMVIIAGQAIPIATMNLDQSYKVIIGVPKDFTTPDSFTLMKMEMKNIHKFLATGKKYSHLIGYRMVHEVMPAMDLGNLYGASKLIFDYRFDYGSINNCSFVYPKIKTIAKNIRFLYEKGYVDTLALSSVGPAFFAITKNLTICEEVFQKNGLKTIKTEVNNNGYTVNYKT